MTAHTFRLDVRPILAGGRDPFAEIMEVARKVPRNGTLVVVAPFDPIPLRDVLGTSGFTSSAMPRAPGEWEITFRRETLPRAETGPGPDEPQARIYLSESALARTWSEGRERHVDARGLAPEAALQAVLDALDAGAATLVAHLDQNIEALYPELARRDCEATFVPGDGAEVRLEISAPG